MSQTGSYITSLVWETSDSEGPTRAEYQTNWNAVDGHAHDNRGKGQGIRCIQTASAPAATGDIQLTGDSLKYWGANSNAVITAMNPAVAVTSLMFSGPAAVATSRFCGILTTSGAPTSGTWTQWDFGYDEGGGVFLCTVAGSPGTWIQIGGAYTGDLKTTLRNTSDSGWALLHGQTVDGTTATYSGLWSYVNTNSLVGAGKPFSGTQAALVLPDLRGYALVGLDNMGGSARNVITALNALGVTTGEATHTLSIAEMPAHTHTVDANSAAGAQRDVATTSGSADAATIASTESTGGGGAHNNVQPSYGVNIQIKL